MIIEIKQKGNFSKTLLFFEKLRHIIKQGKFDKFGQAGVAVLQEATPKDSGLTAASWDYHITYDTTRVIVTWTNSNVTNEGTPIAILIQYGHGTKNGGYVEGVDYINPALNPAFQAIADEAWEEVKKL